MAEKAINPVIKQVLELGPTLAFFLIYLRIRDETFTFGGTDYTGFIVAALIFIPILLVAMGILWFLTGKLSRMQVFTAFMVIFFGGLTAYFNDERFFKMKTTIVYGVMAGILGIGLLRGQSYLQFLMEEFLESSTDPYYAGEVDYGDRAEHCWNGDHENGNHISRLRYNTFYLPRIHERLKESRPPGVVRDSGAAWSSGR